MTQNFLPHNALCLSASKAKGCKAQMTELVCIGIPSYSGIIALGPWNPYQLQCGPYIPTYPVAISTSCPLPSLLDIPVKMIQSNTNHLRLCFLAQSHTLLCGTAGAASSAGPSCKWAWCRCQGRWFCQLASNGDPSGGGDTSHPFSSHTTSTTTTPPTLPFSTLHAGD